MYLKAGSGAGHLAGGGSYVTLMNTTSKDITIVIETIVQCITNDYNSVKMQCYIMSVDHIGPIKVDKTLLFSLLSRVKLSNFLFYRVTTTQNVSVPIFPLTMSTHKMRLLKWEAVWSCSVSCMYYVKQGSYGLCVAPYRPQSDHLTNGSLLSSMVLVPHLIISCTVIPSR